MKHARLIVLALAAILLFASCDQVLEAFYPDFKKGFEGQKDAGVVVKVEIDNSLYYNNSLLDNFKPIRVKLVPYYEMGPNEFFIDTGSIRDAKIYKTDILSNNGKFSKDVFFGDLYNAMWAAFVFVDKNDNNKIDNDEISKLGLIDNNPMKDKADFRYEIYPTSMLARLDQYSKVEPWILEQLNGASGGGSPSAPVAIIQAPGGKGVGDPVEFNGWQSYDPDGYIKQWIWTIKRQDGSVFLPDQKFGQGIFNTSFGEAGTFFVDLRVVDGAGNVSVPYTWTIAIEAGYVERKILITGNNLTGETELPIRFALVRRADFETQMQIETWSSSFNNNGFFDVPEGEWFVIAWQDIDLDWIPDQNEFGSVASNPDQILLTESLPSGHSVDYLDTSERDLINVVVSVSNGAYLPGEFTEKANLVKYNLSVTVDNPVDGLDLDGKAVRIETVAPDWSVLDSSETTLSAGSTVLALNGQDYAPSPNQTRVFVYIDMDGNGYFDDQGVDLYTGYWIYLRSSQASWDIDIYEYEWSYY